MRVLLVEDEPFIAIDLEFIVTGLGHEVVGIADTKHGALDQAAQARPEAALIDLGLRDGFSGIETAELLASRFGVAVAFVTGNAEQLRPPHDRALVIAKPFTTEEIARALTTLKRAE